MELEKNCSISWKNIFIFLRKSIDNCFSVRYNNNRRQDDKAFGPVVQLVRTPACHVGGRGFEPLPGRHLYAGLAHLVERHLAKVEVASSSLVTRSTGLLSKSLGV